MDTVRLEKGNFSATKSEGQEGSDSSNDTTAVEAVQSGLVSHEQFLNALMGGPYMISPLKAMSFQQSQAVQILNSCGYCVWTPELDSVSSLDPSALSLAGPMTGIINGLLNSGFAVPISEYDSNIQILYSSLGLNKEVQNLKTGLLPSKDLIRPVAVKPATSQEVSKAPSEEEEKDDDYLMESHPYEIKYILNKKTNRKLKRMVCKFPGCDKIFEKKWNFKDHIRMHKGETPYRCEECNRSFTQRGNLVKHQRQHKFKSLKSRKIHKCSICSKAFTEKYNLKVSFFILSHGVDMKP